MRNALLLVCTLLLFLMAGAHGFLGGPVLDQQLAAAHAPPDLAHTARLGWWFGSLCMASLGAVFLVAFLRSRRGNASFDAALRVIATVLGGFGVATIAMLGPEPPFIGFVVFGVLAWLATLRKPAGGPIG